MAKAKTTIILESNDEPKIAKKMLADSGLFSDVEGTMTYLKNIFVFGSEKSYGNRHLPGIVKMLLQNGLLKNSYGELVKDKNGGVMFDPAFVRSLSRIVKGLSERESNGTLDRIFDKYFIDRTDKRNKCTQGLPSISFESLQDYCPPMNDEDNFKNNVSSYSIGKTVNGYNVLSVRKFYDAAQLAEYNPDLCYLHNEKKFEHYGNYQVLLFIKDNAVGLHPPIYKRGDNIFKRIGDAKRDDEYGVSSIGVAINTDGIVTITCRHKWQNGASNADFTFSELNNIIGGDFMDYVSNDSPYIKNNLILNKGAMNKSSIKINESDIRKMIAESIRKIFNKYE